MAAGRGSLPLKVILPVKPREATLESLPGWLISREILPMKNK
jgi:hypothetical protein